MRWLIGAALLSLLGAACGGPGSDTPAVATTPSATSATPRAKQASAEACLPATMRPGTYASELHLRGTGSGAVLCHKPPNAAKGSYRACWRIDAAGRVYNHHDTAVPPGIGHPVGNTWAKWAVTSTDGKHRAQGQHAPSEKIDTVEFFSTATGARVAEAHPSKDINKGVSATISATYLVGDMLLLRDSDAGPHEDVVAFTVDGKLVGIVVDEISEGTISIAGTNQVVFAQSGLASAQIYNTGSRKAVMFKRALPAGNTCSDSQLRNLTLGIDDPCDHKSDAAAQSCCAYATEHVAPYAGALAVPLTGGKLLVAKTGKQFGEVEVFDAAKGTRLSVNSALCKAESSTPRNFRP